MQRLSRIVISLLLCGIAGCRSELVQNLEPKEAARMVAILSEAGVTVHQELQTNGNWSLSVNKEALLPAMTVLDLYRLTPLKKEVVEEEKSLFPTPDEERRFSEKKKAQSIEETLRSLPSVLDARVMLTPPSAASIVVFARPNFSVTEDELKAIVSGASGIPISGIHSLLKKDPIEKIAIAENSSHVVGSWYASFQKILFVLAGIILILMGGKIFRTRTNQ